MLRMRLAATESVDSRVRDRTMAHKGLQRPCIDSTVRQGVASRVPQPVSISGRAKPFHELLGAADG
jgi:predicted DNA-binding transcriptional regulator AlpA